MKILFGSDVSFEYMDGGITPENAPEKVRSVKPVFDAADFRLVNLENVFYESPEGEIIKSGPPLRSSCHCVSFLKALGVDTVGLANNHFGDFGAAGMHSTWDCLRQQGISWIGAGETLEEAYRAQVFEKDGVRVSVIAACENEFGTASAAGAGSAGYEPLRLANRIAEEKKKAQYVVVYFHGGNEHNPYPSPKKHDLYRLWTRLGADAVIAMHTHCPQGYEIYEGKPIVYSMGNLYFPSKPEKYAAEPESTWFYGYLTELDFTASGISLKTYPYRFGSVNEPLTLLSGGEKALVAIVLYFAILKVRPTPFCVLDEIEAALDDSNVTRFAQYLHKLTKYTQFIVITHRRGTMTAADRLYGITMQEKGVSTLVSVDLLENELDQ